MPFSHRLPALFAATLATAAATFCVLATFSCKFVKIEAEPGSLLLSADGEELMEVVATFGLFCEEDFYNNDDSMWNLSRAFFYVSISIGSVTAILAWALGIILPPTNENWRLLSILSALNAVLSVPILIILESDPCTEALESQRCSISLGSYYLVISTALWVSVTLSTQCTDPPLWAEDLSAWRIPKYEDEEVGEARTRTNTRTPKSTVKQSDVSLPRVSTESIKDEDFDLYSPSQSSDQSSHRPHRDPFPATLSNTFPTSQTQGRDQFDETTEKSAVSSGHKNETVSYKIPPSTPSRATETLHILPTAVSPKSQKNPGGNIPDTPKSRRSTGSRKTKRNGAKTPSGADILSDLKDFQLTDGDADDENDEHIHLNRKERKANEKFSMGIRTFTKKLNQNTRKRRIRRRPRGGYEPMFDDDDYDSDDDLPFSPPIEVMIKPFANFEEADFGNQDFTDDEKGKLMDDWNALHRAASAGVRKGIQDGYTNDNEKIDFDQEIQGYYSDPEPMHYSSESSVSHLSLSEFNRNSIPYQSEDNSTVSGSSGSRGRGIGGKKGRHLRNRRINGQGSPGQSIKSTTESLLDTTIDEETEQEILEEISDNEAEAILGAYSIKRTFSDPVLPQQERIQSQDHKPKIETRSLNPERLLEFRSSDSSAFDRPSVERKNSESSTSSATDILPLPSLDHAGKKLEVFEPPGVHRYRTELGVIEPKFRIIDTDKIERARALTALGRKETNPLSSPRKHESYSLSPPRHRPLKAQTWKNDSFSLGAMHARHTTFSDSDSGSEDSSNKARKYRIQRLRQTRDRPAEPNGSRTPDRRSAAVRSRARRVRILAPESYDYFPVHSEIDKYNRSPVDPDGVGPGNVVGAVEDMPKGRPDPVSPDSPLPRFTYGGTTMTSSSPQGKSSPFVVSPEISPIDTSNEKAYLGGGVGDDGLLETTLPTDNESSESSPVCDDSSAGQSEFRVDADIAMMTGISAAGDSSSEEELALDEDFAKYGSFEMDDLDLQLIAVRRPIGKEYGDDEASL